MNARFLIAGVLAAAALASAVFTRPAPTPPLPPPEPTGLVLRGLFQGPTAADDAASFSGLTGELADAIEYDGTRATPRITTGAQVEELRTAAREARMKGESLGARQPRVKAAIQKYLDEHAGTEAGELTPAMRSAWVKSFRDVSTAAEAAIR